MMATSSTVLARFRRHENGHVVFLSMLFVLISLGFTVGYLRFVMGERMYFQIRQARAMARLNAYTGLAEKGVPYIKSNMFSHDSVLEGRDVPYMNGFYDSVDCKIKVNPFSRQDEFFASARGTSKYKNFAFEDEPVHYTADVVYHKDTFADYMYFTNEERPGGGPWLGTSVTFGSGERLEGKVFSNDDMRTSQYGCPEFVEGPDGQESEVKTAGIFILQGSCTESIFTGTFEDSVDKIDWPPFTGHDRVRQCADWIFYSDEMININSTDPDFRDTLIMTEIEFSAGQFNVKRWPYIIPPRTYSPFSPQSIDTMRMYYPKFYRDVLHGNVSYTGEIDFQHFDFDPSGPIPENPPTEFRANGYEWGLIEDRTIISSDGVVWIEGGPVRVKGTVGGRYTIATSDSTPYRMAFNNQTINWTQNNIWIVGDIRYEDSYFNGAVRNGSSNRLGLLSSANVIVANTGANGARNSASGTDIVINAAMIAMHESFIVHYWQNTTTDFHFLEGISPKGDGMGSTYHGTPLGSQDFRGTIHIYGSVIQSARGYVKRNNPGPYTQTIGYEKNYNFDYNFRDYPPPCWPETRGADGSVNLNFYSLGEAN